MKAIQRLEKMWDQNRRYTTRYMLVVGGSMFIHAVLAVIFAMAGRLGFVALNGLAIGFYLLWVRLFTRRAVDEWMLLAL